MPNRNRDVECGEGQRSSKSPIALNLSEEYNSVITAVVERLFTQLLGGTCSPRIKLLNIDQVCRATGLGKSTIYSMVDEGKFPKPQRNLGKNLWRESSLISWADANDPNQSN